MMKTFRQQTQLSLRELSLLLKVSHNLIALGEKSRRNLPEAANTKLIALQKTLSTAQEKGKKQWRLLPEALVKEGQKIAEKKQREVSKMERDLEYLKLKLERIRKRYQLLQQKLQFLEARRSEIASTDGRMAKILEVLAERTVLSMRPCGPAVQQLLYLELRTLAFKHDGLVRMMAHLSKVKPSAEGKHRNGI